MRRVGNGAICGAGFPKQAFAGLGETGPHSNGPKTQKTGCSNSAEAGIHAAGDGVPIPFVSSDAW
jgi:hypothetical protein